MDVTAPSTHISSIDTSLPIWAITSFYNPAGYRRRLENFLYFQQALNVPLIVVELSYDGTFQIPLDKADIVIRIPQGGVLWQKERLLNIALEHVPDGVEYLAWLDCDIVFQNPNWHVEAIRLLEKHPLIQLFTKIYDLFPGVRPDNSQAKQYSSLVGTSIVSLFQSLSEASSIFYPENSLHKRDAAFGLAWAAHRSLLDEHKFYDSMVVGSGDRAMACAAYAMFQAAVHTLHLSDLRAAHYLSWATGFNRSVQGDVDCLTGDIFHLWHGTLESRGYKERHESFARMNFDPSSDIRLNQFGAWVWDRERGDLEQFMKGYFESRLEDGSPSEANS